MPAHTHLGPGREFDVIRDLVTRWGDLATGIGDDAAVLDVPVNEQLVVTTDSSVENVHFVRGWLSPSEIAYRATAAAISDLAAMAARPLGLVLAMTIPESWRGDIEAIGEGVGEAARATGTPIVGGDTTRGAELSLTLTVLGTTARPLRRSGARPGDAVYVTGTLGGPLVAVRELYAGRTPDPPYRQRFARPVPRIAEARWLADRGATAAIDISDGLASDLAHIAAASGVRIAIDLETVPAMPGVDVLDAVRSGEEYEVAVTAPATLDVDAFRYTHGIPLTRIGLVEAAPPGVLEARRGGARVDLPHGYDHFSE